MASIDEQMQLLGSQARAAAETLAFSTFEQRSLAVSEGGKSISNQIDLILSANEIDMSNARGQGLDDAMLDRLYLDRTRVESIASSLQAISDLPDPLGRVLSQWERPSGLKIRRVTTPLGVIGVIYESRPNVTADAGALGSPVWRLRQRCSSDNRPVHRRRRSEVAANERACYAVATRLRRPGTGTLFGTPGALLAALCRRQHSGRKLHDTIQLLPHTSPSDSSGLPKTTYSDDAKVTTAAQALRLVDG